MKYNFDESGLVRGNITSQGQHLTYRKVYELSKSTLIFKGFIFIIVAIIGYDYNVFVHLKDSKGVFISLPRVSCQVFIASCLCYFVAL